MIVGDGIGVHSRDHGEKGAGCCVGAGEGGMAAVRSVEVNGGVGVANVLPYGSYRAEVGICGVRHETVMAVKHGVHAFVGTEWGECGAVRLIAVFAAPGSEKYRLGAGSEAADGIYELDGIRKGLPLELAEGKAGFLALRLKDDIVPTLAGELRVRRVALRVLVKSGAAEGLL